MNYISNLLIKNGFVLALFITGLIMLVSFWVSERLTCWRIPGSAIAIITGLVLAYIGGRVTGENGIADIPVLSGFSIMGGPCSVILPLYPQPWVPVSMKSKSRNGRGSFAVPGHICFLPAWYQPGFCLWLYRIRKILPPLVPEPARLSRVWLPAAIGAPSEVITLSIAAGVLKAILVTIATPALAKYIG